MEREALSGQPPIVVDHQVWRGKSAVEVCVCVWLVMWRGNSAVEVCVCVVTDVEGKECC